MLDSQHFDTGAVKLVFELEQLRATRRSGWHHIHEDPESVAEHSHRASALAYLLACREGCPHPEIVVTMVVFHDMHEARTGDDDLVQKRYIKVDGQKAASDQTAELGMVGATILHMWEEVENESSEAGRIAKDADILEMAFTARELMVRGNLDAQAWIDAARGRLKTESARVLLDILESADPSEWWKRMFNGQYNNPMQRTDEGCR